MSPLLAMRWTNPKGASPVDPASPDTDALAETSSMNRAPRTVVATTAAAAVAAAVGLAAAGVSVSRAADAATASAQQPAPSAPHPDKFAAPSTDNPDAAWFRESMKTHDQRIDWFRKARFGMFIHWGVYS